MSQVWHLIAHKKTKEKHKLKQKARQSAVVLKRESLVFNVLSMCAQQQTLTR
mgnify:CR=1 FL=1